MRARGLVALVTFLLTALPARGEEPGRLALDVARELTVEIGPRPAGSAAAGRARARVARRLEAAGLEPREHAFDVVAMPAIVVGGDTFVREGESRWLSGSGRNVWASVS